MRAKLARYRTERPKDANVILQLKGSIFHTPGCHGAKVLSKFRTCRCPIESDLVELPCPSCSRGLVLNLIDGPTDKRQSDADRKRGNKAFFRLSGSFDEPTIAPDIACLFCGTVFSIEKGVVQLRGNFQLPRVDVENMPKELQDFLDATEPPK